jgi:hypothetical protein
MKIHEVITETFAASVTNDNGIPDSHTSAAPGLRSHVNLNNSDAYRQWRYVAHFLAGAGAADGQYHHEPKRDGPNGQHLIAGVYTDGERRILDQAARAFGLEAEYLQLTPDGSTEVADTHRISPVRVRKAR